MGWVVGALVGAWYLLSAASNVVGKLLLQELPRPLTATLAQLAAAAALSALWERRAAPPGYTRALLPLAGAKLGAMLLSQVAIWRMPVSYAHTGTAPPPSTRTRTAHDATSIHYTSTQVSGTHSLLYTVLSKDAKYNTKAHS